MKKSLEELKNISSDDPIDLLMKALVNYDTDLAEQSAKEIVDNNLDISAAIDAMTQAISLVGEGFGSGELWLPDLVGAANAMNAAMPIIEEEIQRKGTKRKNLGTVVLGTVAGDIHSIGKNMVGTLLTAEGFKVRDLGVDIPAEQFVKAVKEEDADILALSALLTMTAPEQKKVIEALKSEGVRDKVKIMVGGGAINHDFASKIGADGYDPTAVGCVTLAKKLASELKAGG